ncbi:DUF2599 domain-containing protein [Pseudomonas putida]|nr:DUF2599 domain-containing protein [Pseudomonas putida]
MNNHGVSLTLAALLACNGGLAFAQSCVETAQNQQKRYEATPNDCGKSSSPAFLCSGIILRATEPAAQEGLYNSWDVSPTSEKTQGTSFSYLRKDANFRRLVQDQNNGYILSPIVGLPASKQPYSVLCAFPIDGGTNSRVENGCGTAAVATAPKKGAACHRQDITTAEQWVAQYQRESKGDNRNACGFAVRDELNSYASANFNASLRAMRLGDTFYKQNELRLANWKRDAADATLPIESFFYLSGDAEGLEDARLDQTRYLQETGLWVPIVALTMPDRPSGSARFACNAADQAIAENDKVPVEDYIASGTWVLRPDPGTGKDEWTLSLKLTPKGQSQKGSSGSDAVYAEMRRKFGNDFQWTQNDGGGMRRQLVCHYVIARNKEEFNLEPFRPNVSEEAAEKASCNPV